MQRVLLIKFTSLGDLIHALPALTDASREHPELKFDWMIDEGFSEVATWHRAVNRIYKTNHRTWKKGLLSAMKPIADLVKEARQTEYDLIIDGQGNFKTALMSLFMRGPTAGFDRKSVREKVAAMAYGRSYPASWKAHAIDRLRQLFAQSFDYPLPLTAPDYGIDRSHFTPLPFRVVEKYIVLVHNASWVTKLWPEEHEIQLLEWLKEKGYTVYLPWGNGEEKARAERLAGQERGVVLPRLSLSEIGTLLLGAKGCVSVDTGLSHLAAALHVPTITLYGSTDAGLIGASGENQIHLQSTLPCAPCHQKRCRIAAEGSLNPPCLAALTPERVFVQLIQMVEPSGSGRRVLDIYNR